MTKEQHRRALNQMPVREVLAVVADLTKEGVLHHSMPEALGHCSDRLAELLEAEDHKQQQPPAP